MPATLTGLPCRDRLLTNRHRMGTKRQNLAHVPGRRPGDSVRRGECGSRGQRLVTSALGRLGQDTPDRHHDRYAGAISLGWDSKARVMPASDAWEAGPSASRKNVLRCARSFEPSGLRALSLSWEVAWLKLSGGVRSLPQVPWWNAERRARPLPTLPRKRGREERGARRAVRHGGYGTAPFGVPLSFFRHCEERLRRSNPDFVPPTLDCLVASLLAMTRFIRA